MCDFVLCMCVEDRRNYGVSPLIFPNLLFISFEIGSVIAL